MRVLLGLTFVAMLALVPSCSHKSISGDDSRQNVPTISSVRDIGRLELAEMTISKMGTIDDLKPEQAQGLKKTALALFNELKIGDRKAAYSYDTYMRAYIDLNSLDSKSMKVDTAAKMVTLRLPEIQIELAGRDAALREEHYRVTGLRSNINADERAQLKEEMNKLLREEVCKNDVFANELKKQASAKAKSYFQTLFSSMNYNVTFVK